MVLPGVSGHRDRRRWRWPKRGRFRGLAPRVSPGAGRVDRRRPRAFLLPPARGHDPALHRPRRVGHPGPPAPLRHGPAPPGRAGGLRPARGHHERWPPHPPPGKPAPPEEQRQRRLVRHRRDPRPLRPGAFHAHPPRGEARHRRRQRGARGVRRLRQNAHRQRRGRLRDRLPLRGFDLADPGASHRRGRQEIPRRPLFQTRAGGAARSRKGGGRPLWKRGPGRSPIRKGGSGALARFRFPRARGHLGGRCLGLHETPPAGVA